MKNIYTHEETINRSISAAKKTINILSSISGIPYDSIKQKMNIRKDLGLDDLKITELATDLEEQFDVKIPGRHSSRWQTVGDIVYYIARRLEGYQS